MSKGYVILAQNNKSDDYVRMAYGLALSIKNTQKEVTSVTLITDIPDAVPHHCVSIFDNIIQIPWFDDALESDWKVENRWKIYHITPYDETILLDADMIFLSNIDNWWNYLSDNFDLFVTTKTITYRNEPITSDYYRKVFTENDLPNAYSAFTYFKKTDFSKEFWMLVEIISKNWQVFYNKYLPKSKPKHLSMDVVFALAIKILGIEDQVTSTLDYPTFVHMKSRIQGWNTATDNWMDFAGVYFNKKNELKISNYQQFGIFHYTEKKFLSNYVLNAMEKKYESR